jgi:hypothetical protein
MALLLFLTQSKITLTISSFFSQKVNLDTFHNFLITFVGQGAFCVAPSRFHRQYIPEFEHSQRHHHCLGAH